MSIDFKITKRTVVVIGIIAAAASAFFILILGLSIFLKFFNCRGEEEEKDMYKYRFLQHDISGRTNSAGFLTLTDPLDEGEFILREKPGLSITLIYDFSSDEYICSGSCHCDELDEERRGAAGALVGGGLVTLVAAISASIAIKQANNHFQTECEEVYSTSCISDSIISSVDRCERVIIRRKKKDKVVEEYAEEIKEVREEVMDVKYRRYECTGKCLPSEDILTEPGRKFAKEFGCHKLQKTDKISIEESLIKGKVGEEERAVLERAFIFKHLAWFCPTQSVGNYWFFIKDKATKANKRLGVGVKKTARACVGSTYDHAFKMKRNRSIKCVPLFGEPEPVEEEKDAVKEFKEAWDKLSKSEKKPNVFR